MFHSSAAVLRASNLVRTGGARGADAIEPYHDRIREAVVGRLDGARRRALHEALANAFEGSRHADPETLAAHWRDAGDLARAAKHAVAAADQASKAFAFERAAEWYQRGLEWMPPGDALSRTLHVRIGEMLANAGRGSPAAHHFEIAAAGAPPGLALELRRRAAQQFLAAGCYEPGNAALRLVLDDIGIGFPRTPLHAVLGVVLFRLVLFVRGLAFTERSEDEIPARALTRLDTCSDVARLLGIVDPLRGAYFQTRGLLAALALGEQKRVSHAIALEAIYAAAEGRTARSEALLVQAGTLAQRTGSLEVQAVTEGARALACHLVGRFPEGLAAVERCASVLREHCPGAWNELLMMRISSAWMAAWTGNLNLLAVTVDDGLREARHRGDVYLETTLRTGQQNLRWLRGGDTTGARAIVVEAIGQWTRIGYDSQHYWALYSLARIDLYGGDGRAAYARITREWSRVRRTMLLRTRIIEAEARDIRARAALAVAATESGSERARMIRAAERDARALEAMRWTVSAAFAQTIRAGVAVLRGDQERAATRLGDAARSFDASSMALHASSVRWQLGRIRGGEHGRALTVEAEDWMLAQGVVDPRSMAAAIALPFESAPRTRP